MRLFNCSHCNSPTYFENLICLSCNYLLAYEPSDRTMVAFENAEIEPGAAQAKPKAEVYAARLCANRANAACCNWLVGKNQSSALCQSCQLTSVYPPQETEAGKLAWKLSEQAKRRWLFTILKMGLPARPKLEDQAGGITFHILQPGADKTSVLTGHNDGLITINAAESDPVERVARRSAMEEPYRTLLGHFRHESGHYYWQVLVKPDAARLASCRKLFGDDRLDYAESLDKNYRDGPPAEWEKSFISAYASSHPWEDFAETWAHYMHMIDALELAQSWGLQLPNYPAAEIIAFANQASPETGFAALLKRWLPLSLFANSLNRTLGHEDAYPFAPSSLVIDKLAWIHQLIVDNAQA